jgi:flagellar motor switch protein FliM
MSAAPATSEAAESAPAPAVVFRADGSRFPANERIAVEAVDFRNPTFLAEGELRRLRSAHIDYLRALNSRLSTLLRSELALNLGKFGTQSCESFIEGLKNPTQIALFRVSALNSVGYVEIPPKLAIALTTRILGGRESAGEADVYLTEIETALLEDVIAIITAEWCEQWRDETKLEASLIGHETNPRFIQATAKSAMMLVVGIEVAFGRCEEVIQLAVPLSMIEPMMKRLHAARARQTGALRIEGGAAWKASYDDIAIPVHAEMVAAHMTVAGLLKLQKGDVIELPSTALESTQISVAGAVRFTARAGQQDGFIAVQITDKNSAPRK